MRRLGLALALTLLCAASARADSIHEKHARAFGDRAWIADALFAHYRDKAAEAGPNYERLPVALREHQIRTELAMVGCLVTNHLASEKRGPSRRALIIEHCWDNQRDWLGGLYRAMHDSGAFPYRYFGQTSLAFIPTKAVHAVLRATIAQAKPFPEEVSLFRILIVPLLREACRSRYDCSPANRGNVP